MESYKPDSPGSHNIHRLPRGQLHQGDLIPEVGKKNQLPVNSQSLVGTTEGRIKTVRKIPLLGTCAIESKIAQGEISTCAVET